MQSLLLISGHEFIGINSFLFILLILVCLLLGGLIKRYDFHYLPESGASMLFGLVCGGVLNLTSDNEKEILEFSPNLIFFVILPPIILDAGYTLKRKDFFQNIGTILLLAILGTVINNLVFGYMMFGFAKLGWIPLDSNSPLECLLFGAVISATDPVATLAMLGSKEVNAHPLLYSLVFGESVLNDAIAIVLYKTFEGALPSTDDCSTTPAGGEADIAEARSFNVVDLFKALGTFIGVSCGSVLVGIGVALACCFIFKRIDFSTMPVYEFTLVTLFAYLSYFMAEMMYLSGIMSLFFCSICLAHYNYYNISTNAQIATQESFKSIAQICETFVFAYIGITAGLSIQTSHLLWSGGMIILTIITCLVARAANVFPLCTLANVKRHAKKIPLAMQVPLWFAGLRGAVAFALSLSFPSCTHRKYVVSSTLMLVLFTTIIGGGLTLPILRWTGMSRPIRGAPSSDGASERLASDEGDEERENGHKFELLANGEREEDSHEEKKDSANTSFEAASFPGSTSSQQTPSQPAYSGLVAKFKRFDKTFMRTWFGGAQTARGAASGIIDEYGAPVPLPGTTLRQQELAMRSPNRSGMIDPEEDLSGVGGDEFVSVSSQPHARFHQDGELFGSSSPEYRAPPPARRGSNQPSYKRDEDELKSIFKPSGGTSSSPPNVAASSTAYQPPVFSPQPPSVESPNVQSATSTSLHTNRSTSDSLQDTEEM